MFERRVRMCASLRQDSSQCSTNVLQLHTLRVLCYYSICLKKQLLLFDSTRLSVSVFRAARPVHEKAASGKPG